MSSSKPHGGFSNPKVDYDQVADQYNQRYRANPLNGIEQSLAQLGQTLNAQRILEVGCGTGRWLHGLRRHLPQVQFFGLDASRGMLAKAAEAAIPLRLVQGVAAKLPFAGQKFDFIFCVHALHHFDDPAGFIHQASQLLRPGGVLGIVGQVPHDQRNRWYVYDYFEGVYEKDRQRFPRWETVTAWMSSAGFQQMRCEPVEWISDDKIGWAVLDDPFLQKQATSQLTLLSEEAYAAGIEKIKTTLQKAQNDGEPLIFKSQLRLDMLTGAIPEDN